MPIETVTNLDYLIDSLRMKLGDTNAATYRYLDSWLRTSLVTAVGALQRWWNFRYLIDPTTYDVSRNTLADYTYEEADGLIQKSDEWPIVLMAAIIIKEGALENHAWTMGSWRDAEVSYSNISSGSALEGSIRRDWDELKLYLKSPNKQLTPAHRMTILDTTS